MREYADTQGFEPIETDSNQPQPQPLSKVDVNVSKPEVNQELTGNQPQPQPLSKVDVNVSKPEVNQELTGNKPVFPATQRECAQYFNISPAALGKWVKNIEATGNSITTNSRRITSEGFELLCEYSQAGDRAYFLECLQPPQSQESNALAIRSESNLVSYGIDFDELFETVETDYNALDSSESATSQELAIYEAELVEFGQSYNTKEAQAHAILLRKEAEKAALLAKEVHQVKQAAYHQTLQRLEAKSTNFR